MRKERGRGWMRRWLRGVGGVEGSGRDGAEMKELNDAFYAYNIARFGGAGLFPAASALHRRACTALTLSIYPSKHSPKDPAIYLSIH